MTNLKQKLLQEGFVTQLNDNQLNFYHNKYRTTIKNPRNIPFETLVALLKTIQKLDENNINIIIDDNQSVSIQNKSDNSSIQTTVDNLQKALINIYKTNIRKEN